MGFTILSMTNNTCDGNWVDGVDINCRIAMDGLMDETYSTFCIICSTLSDKISADKIFGGQNFSVDKIFDTNSKFRQFCPTKMFYSFYVLTRV